jgi:hypothetical protein
MNLYLYFCLKYPKRKSHFFVFCDVPGCVAFFGIICQRNDFHKKYILHELGVRIGVTTLITRRGGWVGRRVDYGYEELNLRRIKVRKLGNIRLNQSLINNDLKQRAQGMYNATLSMQTGDSDASFLRPIKHTFFVFTPPK